MKKYLQSTEVKDWMRFKRRKADQIVHSEEDFKTRHSVRLECHAFPKHRNHHNRTANQNERKQKTEAPSADREVGCLFTKPKTSPPLGKVGKRTAATKAATTTTVGCETLTTTSHLPPTNTECSSKLFHVRDMKYDAEGILTRRPMMRRELTCSSLIEEVKRQRALKAKLELRKRERQAMHIVSVRSRNRYESRTALRNENKGLSEALRKNCFQETRLTLKEDEVVARRGYEVGPESPAKRRPVATARNATAILQDALEALECAHRWNEWGARTLRHLARVTKVAKDRNPSFQSWKPRILLPHDKGIPSSGQGRVLKSREEEREFIRDLMVTSNLTNEEWLDSEPTVNRHFLKLRFQTEQEETKRRILCDFVDELLRHELLMRSAGLYLRQGQEQYQGQALVQKVWNNLQVLPSPAAAASSSSPTGICAAVQLILEQDFKAEKESTLVEVCEVERELVDMIFKNLVQELLEELEQITALRR